MVGGAFIHPQNACDPAVLFHSGNCSCRRHGSGHCLIFIVFPDSHSNLKKDKSY